MSSLTAQTMQPQRFTYASLRPGRPARRSSRCWWRMRVGLLRPRALTLARSRNRTGVVVSVSRGLVTASAGVGRPVTIASEGMSRAQLVLLLAQAGRSSNAADVVDRWRTGLALLSVNTPEEVQS